jgi:CubicO group peptidase (beta-lactamase class C family)
MTEMRHSGLWMASGIAVLALALITNMANAQPSPHDIDAAVLRAMEAFSVPGMSVSVVKDGTTYYASGQGVAEFGERAAVDGQTLFQIGSVSKAFTAASLAILVDEGKLGWDDHVIDSLPEFQMYDAWVTREFTIRDLLTHRSGLPLGAGDLLIFPDGNATRAEIIHAFRYLEPSSSFRSKFDYDNLLYIVAGEVVERVSGMPFEDFLEQRLLIPIGMDDCVATPSRTNDEAVQATPHVLMDSGVETTTSGLNDVTAPAGGITCSASSMAKWMLFVLNRGETESGAQLISIAQFDQLLKPVTLVSAPGYMVENAGSHLNAYALGWNVSTFYGQPSLSHGGAVWGMTTFILILPDQGLGVFASNNLLSPAPRAIVAEIADEFLADAGEAENQDWITIISDVSRSRQEAGAAVVEEAAASRDADSTPSLSLERYAGTYRDPWYGDVEISLEDDGRLWFRSERNEPLQGPLEHFQYDTFIALWTDRQLMADAYVSFSLSPEGSVERIRMKAVSPTTDFSYDFHDLDLRYVRSE